VRALLVDKPGNEFLEDFRAVAVPITWIGFLNSLGMATVKYTSPGVPDCYQGNEIWDFSLVDPDNRRPVDYERRRGLLAQVEALGENPPAQALGEIFRDLEDGRAKLYVMWRLLHLRRQREALFRDGGYMAVRTTGERARHALAFARRSGKDVSITVVPRLMVGLGIEPGALPCGPQVWGDTRIELPFLAEGDALRNALTGEEVRVAGGGIAVAGILARAPVAVMSR
jgi:(1->4)-alpha-D-glucan 1-alpha-D-glucosylmutase